MIRMKIIVLSILYSVGVWGESPSLFGQVVNVGQNDTLNVRTEPNYKAKKITELMPGLYIGLDRCIYVSQSKWCKTYSIVQNAEEYKDGWVNARYLKFSNHGYVNIAGKEKDCFYALKCREIEDKKECLVVYELNYDYEKDEMIDIKSKWIERKKLKGESMFGAASQNREINPEGGYCTNGKMIDNYLEINEKK